MTGPVNSTDRHIATLLWVTGYSLERLDGKHTKILSDKGIHLRDLCRMRIDPEREAEGKKRTTWSEEYDWYMDGELIEQLKKDPDKASAMRKIVMLSEALVPDIFKPGATEEDIARAINKYAEGEKDELQRRFAYLRGGPEFKANPIHEQLGKMLDHMHSNRYIWDNAQKLKEEITRAIPDFFDEKHVLPGARILAERVHEAANEITSARRK